MKIPAATPIAAASSDTSKRHLRHLLCLVDSMRKYVFNRSSSNILRRISRVTFSTGSLVSVVITPFSSGEGGTIDLLPPVVEVVEVVVLVVVVDVVKGAVAAILTLFSSFAGAASVLFASLN